MILDMFSAKITLRSYRIKDVALMLFVIAKLEICLIKKLIIVDVPEHFCDIVVGSVLKLLSKILFKFFSKLIG